MLPTTRSSTLQKSDEYVHLTPMCPGAVGQRIQCAGRGSRSHIWIDTLSWRIWGGPRRFSCRVSGNNSFADSKLRAWDKTPVLQGDSRSTQLSFVNFRRVMSLTQTPLCVHFHSPRHDTHSVCQHSTSNTQCVNCSITTPLLFVISNSVSPAPSSVPPVALITIQPLLRAGVNEQKNFWA